jgi:hypothetical protein
MKFLSDDKFREAISEARDEAYTKAYRNAKKQFVAEIRELEDSLEEAVAENKSLVKNQKNLQSEIDILNKERKNARDLTAQRIELEDREARLEANEESNQRRIEFLNDLEAKIGDKEEGQYKTGYADGVADGVRKINEITAQDRENAMKVAMVAAASHSTPEVIRELNNGTKALTEGTSNKEDK